MKMSFRDNIKKFQGYRGTTKEWVEKAKNREFKVSTSDDEYFGHCIYFFQDDPKEAYNWARY